MRSVLFIAFYLLRQTTLVCAPDPVAVHPDDPHPVSPSSNHDPNGSDNGGLCSTCEGGGTSGGGGNPPSDSANSIQDIGKKVSSLLDHITSAVSALEGTSGSFTATPTVSTATTAEPMITSCFSAKSAYDRCSTQVSDSSSSTSLNGASLSRAQASCLCNQGPTTNVFDKYMTACYSVALERITSLPGSTASAIAAGTTICADYALETGADASPTTLPYFPTATPTGGAVQVLEGIKQRRTVGVGLAIAVLFS